MNLSHPLLLDDTQSPLTPNLSFLLATALRAIGIDIRPLSLPPRRHSTTVIRPALGALQSNSLPRPSYANRTSVRATEGRDRNDPSYTSQGNARSDASHRLYPLFHSFFAYQHFYFVTGDSFISDASVGPLGHPSTPSRFSRGCRQEEIPHRRPVITRKPPRESLATSSVRLSRRTCNPPPSAPFPFDD